MAANQSFGFSRGLERVALLEAYTRKADGTVLAVAPDAVLDSTLPPGGTDFPSFSDWRVRTIVFPDVQAGDTVHYVLLRRARRALFPGAYEATLTGGPQANVAAADIAITLPVAMRLAVAASGLAEDAPVPEGDRVRPALAPGGGVDGSDDGEVRLRVSTFASYAALGDAFAARALPAAEPSDAIGALADRLTAGLASAARRRRGFTLMSRRGSATSASSTAPGGWCRTMPRHRPPRLWRLQGSRGAAAGAARGEGHLLRAGADQHQGALCPATAADAGTARPRADLHPRVRPLSRPDLALCRLRLLPFEDYDKPVVLAGAGGARLARTPPLLPGAAATETRTEARITADGSVIGSTVTTASGPAAVTLREVAAGIEEDGGDTTAADDLRRLGTPGHGDFDFASPRDHGRRCVPATRSRQIPASARYRGYRGGASPSRPDCRAAARRCVPGLGQTGSGWSASLLCRARDRDHPSAASPRRRDRTSAA